MNTRELLDQNTIWITADRMPIKLVDMDPDHRRNTLAMLRRKAAYQMKAYLFCEIRDLQRFGGPPDGYDETDYGMITDSPEAWIERRPLVIELARLVRKDQLDSNTVDGEVVPTRQELEHRNGSLVVRRTP